MRLALERASAGVLVLVSIVVIFAAFSIQFAANPRPSYRLPAEVMSTWMAESRAGATR